ncbi:Tripartite tricarboxylate transporter TctA family protein [uncultured archaeon]|nr:Tripartite tricarboxylate transporter TctA family protein [uncultured archaeon]
MLQAAALLIGILLGIFSGLVPGIHSNTVASLLSTLPVPPDLLVFAIVAVLGAHLVFQFLPSIFLSIPDDTVVTSVLPGHRMALEGRGKEALLVCVSSVIAAVALSALLLPVAMVALPFAYSFIEPVMAWVLVGASAVLLASEREWRKIALASLVFLLAGALGIATTRAPINDPLFPAFSGLFAVSGILLSFTSHRKLPEQKEGRARVDYLPYVVVGVFFGMFSDLLPGIAAPAQIAVFASLVLFSDEARDFLALVSAIAASHMVFAFSALLSIGKAREGALAILQEIRPVLPADLPMLLGIFLLSVGISALVLMRLSKYAHVLERLDMSQLNLCVLGYIVCAAAIISGGAGLLLLATSAAIGMLPPLLGIRRTHVMGLIIVPSILLAL